MPSSFTKSKQKQTQSTTLPQAGQMENALYDQLFNLSNQQAGSLTQQNALQRAMLNPHQTLLDLQQPWQGRTQADSQAHMTKVMGRTSWTASMRGVELGLASLLKSSGSTKVRLPCGSRTHLRTYALKMCG